VKSGGDVEPASGAHFCGCCVDHNRQQDAERQPKDDPRDEEAHISLSAAPATHEAQVTGAGEVLSLRGEVV
jgi:hypothetical protein